MDDTFALVDDEDQLAFYITDWTLLETTGPPSQLDVAYANRRQRTAKIEHHRRPVPHSR